jgi:hypothetical protein
LRRCRKSKNRSCIPRRSKPPTKPRFTFQKDASTLTAGHPNELLLGDSTAGDFYAGDLGAFIFASGGADALYGGAGKDILVGGTGADLLKSAGDSDILDGGARNDLYDISQSAQDEDEWNGDWSFEENLARQPEIYFRPGSGHDVIIETYSYDGSDPYSWDFDQETETIPGWDIGLEAVVFEGINSTDVTLHWDRHQSDRSYDESINSYWTAYTGMATLKLNANDTLSFYLTALKIEKVWPGTVYTGLISPFELIFEDRTVEDWSDLFSFESVQAGALGPVDIHRRATAEAARWIIALKL